MVKLVERIINPGRALEGVWKTAFLWERKLNV